MKLTTLLHCIEPGALRKTRFLLALMSYLTFAVILGTFSIFQQFLASKGIFVITVPGTIFTFLFVPIYLAWAFARPSRIVRDNRLALSRKRILEFSDEGITMRFDSGSNSFIVWADIESAKHKDGVVTLFLTKLYSHVVPDSAWPSTVERDQFLDLLRTKGLLK